MSTTSGAEQFVFRQARTAETKLTRQLDDSFTTAKIFEVAEPANEPGFVLKEKTLQEPLHKIFPHEDEVRAEEEEDDNEPTHLTIVALTSNEQTIAGFICTKYADWNKRLSICNVAVAPSFRRRGLASKIFAMALEHGKQQHGAKQAWLEVSNVNVPAINAYKKYGFKLCGIDLSLYDHTPAKGEFALFMSQPL